MKPLLCSHRFFFFFISTWNLSGETVCQKLHFMYYRRPFGVYSCVINFHFKAISTWNDVRQWGLEVVACSNGEKKKNPPENKDKKKKYRQDGITQSHTTKICTWKKALRCTYPLHAHKPLHFCPCTHTHTHTVLKQLRVTVLISRLVTSFSYRLNAGILAVCYILSIPSYLYKTTYPMQTV